MILQNEALDFFSKLFAPTVQHQSVLLPIENHTTIGHACMTSLLAPVSKDEVYHALKFMKSFTAPGPDGFQPFFFFKMGVLILALLKL